MSACHVSVEVAHNAQAPEGPMAISVANRPPLPPAPGDTTTGLGLPRPKGIAMTRKARRGYIATTCFVVFVQNIVFREMEHQNQRVTFGSVLRVRAEDGSW